MHVEVLLLAVFVINGSSYKAITGVILAQGIPKSTTPWFLVGNGGMDPYDSPSRSPVVVPKPHSPIPY